MNKIRDSGWIYHWTLVLPLKALCYCQGVMHRSEEFLVIERFDKESDRSVCIAVARAAKSRW